MGRNLPQAWQNQRSASKANRKLVSNLPESGWHETQLAIRASSLSLLAVSLAARSLVGCLVGGHVGVIQRHVLFDNMPCGSRALQAFATPQVSSVHFHFMATSLEDEQQDPSTDRLASRPDRPTRPTDRPTDRPDEQGPVQRSETDVKQNNL